ncbi:hypothetical protein PR048_032279 [Dryococelus australis]|uniref:Uncharacterized protein n=1 Tax=Dryococelus australis TaxID=614101 RepID=A0ABQ9G1S8_9NEOP|nr:hypothetical protein PR048_032279 [Dryococelus australis]
MGEDAFILYKISFHYYCLVGTVVVIAVGLIVSYLTGFQDPETVDDRLLVSFVKKYGNSREKDTQHPSEKEMLNMKKIEKSRRNSH